MKTYFYSLFLVCSLCFAASTSHAQTEIFGAIKDSSDSTGVSFATVILYPYQSTKILTYTQTDEDGNYRLRLKESRKGIYRIEARQLAYHKFEQTIVISDSSVQSIPFSFFMQPNVEMLDAVVVQGPVIVIKDTIIYDIEQFRRVNDQTLEDVLVDIPGFKILANGDIQVEGKTVQKVLINGEEVMDAGATLMTRSLSAENVKSVEVRFDEKSDKLKESLLDTEKYVVLDIKLDEELNTSWFGKGRFTLGHQDQIRVGGYVNVFSLKEKLKTHIFAEHDDFGEQTISLMQIKNIGQEAVQQMFDTPADFALMMQREAFQDEIFGFRNYTRSQKDIIGISSKLSISPSLDMYVGSYNSYDKNEKERNYLQNFEAVGLTNQLREFERLSAYSTKNKVEFKFDKERIKAKFNANAVLFKNDLLRQNTQSDQNLEYRFGDVHRAVNFYENVLLEWKPTKRLGFHLKAAHTYLDATHEKFLYHNDSSYTLFGTALDEDGQFEFRQPITSRANSFISEAMAQYQSTLGVFRSGLRYHFRSLDMQRDGFALLGNESSPVRFILPEFTASETDQTTWSTSRMMGFLGHQMAFGDFAFNNQVQLIHIDYPLPNDESTQERLWGYRFNVDYSPTQNNISFSYTRNISNFPIEKLVPAYELIDFQTIRLPAEELAPLPEYTIMGDISTYWKALRTRLSAAALYGSIQNADQFLLPESNLFFVLQNQLQSDYFLVSTSIKTSLKSVPIDLVLEPEYVLNRTENELSADESYFANTERYLLGLKINSDFEEIPINFSIYPKYSAFLFGNELTNSENRQDMASLNASLQLSLYKEKLLVSPRLRTVRFLRGDVNSTFSNISLDIQANYPKWRWFLTAENLLNDTVFVRQFIYPTYFVDERSSVFGRFFRLGVEYKWK